MQSDVEIQGSAQEPLVLAFLSELVTDTRSAGLLCALCSVRSSLCAILCALCVFSLLFALRVLFLLLFFSASLYGILFHSLPFSSILFSAWHGRHWVCLRMRVLVHDIYVCCVFSSSMYVLTHVNPHASHVFIHTNTSTYLHIYIHTCMHTYMHAYIHACMHTYIHTYIHTCIQ